MKIQGTKTNTMLPAIDPSPGPSLAVTLMSSLKLSPPPLSPPPMPLPLAQLLLTLSLLLAAVGIVPFKQVIANAVILSTADGDCDKPIYDWIAVIIALYATKVGLLGGLAGLVAVQRKVTLANTLVIVLFLTTELAVIAWSIVGSVWMDESATCKDSECYHRLQRSLPHDPGDSNRVLCSHWDAAALCCLCWVLYLHRREAHD